MKAGSVPNAEKKKPENSLFVPWNVAEDLHRRVLA
jgi:hypothetical protein